MENKLSRFAHLKIFDIMMKACLKMTKMTKMNLSIPSY